jgi:lysozyme
MQISDNGLAMIKSFEGCVLEAYLCPAGIWTIGYGHTEGVTDGDVWTQEQADDALIPDSNSIAAEPVNRLVTVPLTQNQFDALSDFTYNLGQGNLSSSTLLKLLNQGDYAGAQDQFQYWNLCDGEPSEGLTRRRTAEADLFGTPDANPPAVPDVSASDQREMRNMRGRRFGHRRRQ